MKKIIIFLLIPIIIFITLVFSFKNDKNKNNQKRKENEYSVKFSPCGTVHFKNIPNKILTAQETYNDILLSFNYGQNIIAVGSKDKIYYEFYTNLNLTNLPNVDSIFEISTARNTFDKELFYLINADIHHIDPVALSMTKGWKKSDIIEISKNIGPFFANRYSIENKKPAHLTDYQFYTLDEINLKFGEVYKKEEVAKKLNLFTYKLIKRIQKQLPQKSKKRIAIVYLCRKGIVPFDSTSNGYGLSQYKILGCIDAFKDAGIKTYAYEGNFGTMLDEESLLLANPDVIIINEGIYIDPKYKFFSKRTELLLAQFERFKKNPLLKDIPAFKNNQIILGGIYDQGPITRIYQLEMMAKQIYPEIFGKFNINHKYSEDEELFSREELRKIIFNE